MGVINLIAIGFNGSTSSVKPFIGWICFWVRPCYNSGISRLAILMNRCTMQLVVFNDVIAGVR